MTTTRRILYIALRMRHSFTHKGTVATFNDLMVL